ncbi:MAG: FGGY family carbohydrate kinase [Armatimonadota bacterium]
MAAKCAVILDCGSTNITVMAVSPTGEILASASRANEMASDPQGQPGWLIWDMEAFWERICAASREMLARLQGHEPASVAVTTWGADGAPVRADGSLTHAPIAWACPRTEPLAADFASLMDPWQAYRETGYLVIPFNTLLKLIWLRQNAPGPLDDAACWMMMAGLLNHRLCGEMSLDATGAGTTMAVNSGARTWSPRMLSLAEVTPDFFPRWCEPGEVVGELTSAAAANTGLPAGIPVVAAGHDTQFAVVGACAREGEAILSSGTWEILMLRDPNYRANQVGYKEGVLIELDAQPGLWNPQLLMMASGVLEWLRDMIYPELADRPDAYEVMVNEARQVPPGSNGVIVLPSFEPSTGPNKKYATSGTLLGLELATTRGHLYRAALEGLSCQLRQAAEVLHEATGYNIWALRVVGGGSKNPLWNQIRADVTGLPIVTTAQKEATVVGAAAFAFVGAGFYDTIVEAQEAMRAAEEVIEPSTDRSVYDEVYERYMMAPPALAEFYSRA